MIKISNNAYSTLASGINDVVTSISVAAGHGARFPALSAGDYFYATLIDSSNNLEIVKVTARSTDTLTVERGAESTTARAYTSGDRIEQRFTAGTITDFFAGVKGADVASAGTVTVVSGAIQHITGTTTITDIDFSPANNGAWAWLIFDGALTLTHHATTLKLPGGANITTAADDRVLVYQDSSDNAVVLTYVPASGAAPAGAASTTDVLTGTNTGKTVTADALAALWEAGSDNTGGATITMGEGGYFNLITSTTAITALAFTTDKAGRTAIVRFDTARTLTHNATSLILPGAANITTVAGDRAQIRSLGSGNFIVDWYTRANGAPVLGGVIDSQQPTSDVASVVTTGLSTCRKVEVWFAFSHNAAQRTYTLQGRTSGGTWRDIFNFLSLNDSASSVAGYCSIANFNVATEKLARYEAYTNALVLDDSTATNNPITTTTTTPGMAYVARNEIWDELQITTSSGTPIEGGTADQRGRWYVMGTP